VKLITDEMASIARSGKRRSFDISRNTLSESPSRKGGTVALVTSGSQWGSEHQRDDLFPSAAEGTTVVDEVFAELAVNAKARSVNLKSPLETDWIHADEDLLRRPAPIDRDGGPHRRGDGASGSRCGRRREP